MAEVARFKGKNLSKDSLPKADSQFQQQAYRTVPRAAPEKNVHFQTMLVADHYMNNNDVIESEE
jgi:hypothetical protein